MSKVKLSSEQVKTIKNCFGYHWHDRFSQLQGRLLTTLDAAIENDRQLESLKARVRDIQGLMWDDIFRDKEQCLSRDFVSGVEDADDDTVVHKGIEQLIYQVNSSILDRFDVFISRLENLVGMVLTDERKDCLIAEIVRIVRRERYLLMRNFALDLRQRFGIKEASEVVPVSK